MEQEQVRTALADWILRVTKGPATPAEIRVLPEVAKAYFDSISLGSETVHLTRPGTINFAKPIATFHSEANKTDFKDFVKSTIQKIETLVGDL